MHHLYPSTKGDSLCPLGFHPQVRWPTRCKRCFRDYKEHCIQRNGDEANLRRDSVTASSPSLSQSFGLKEKSRNWASSDNLHENKEKQSGDYKSTADLTNLDESASYTTYNLKLPSRRSSTASTVSDNEQNDKSPQTKKRVQVKEVKPVANGPNNDVQYFIQVKKKNESSDSLKKELEETQNELETLRTKCDRLEREKREVILRRLPAMSTGSNLGDQKLHKKCTQLEKEVTDYKDEKRTLQQRINKLEDELKLNSNGSDLGSKLRAAETLCEELMDENETLKKEVREMEEQIDEMQDNFREDQVVEYTSIKSELEQTTKNCRILSFKLRKAERRAEQLEQEKKQIETKVKEISEKQINSNSLEKIKQLEQELANSNNVSTKLQTELGVLNKKLSDLELSKTGGNKLEKKVTKISRQSLIRSASQEETLPLPPPDTSEIERDLREQLKFSEEEVFNLRKKISRVEGDNELLILQLNKIAGQVRNGKAGSNTTKDITDLISSGDNEELKLHLEYLSQKGKDDSLNTIQESTKSLQAEINKQKEKINDLEDKIKKANALLDDEKQKTKAKELELTKATKKWESESKSLKTKIQTLEETNEALQTSVKEAHESVTKLEKRLSNEKTKAKTAASLEIEKLKKEIEERNSRVSQMQLQLENLQSSENSLSEQIKQITQQKEDACNDLQKNIKNLKLQLKEEKKKSEALKNETETLNNDIKSLKLQVANSESQITGEQKTKLKQLESKVTTLEAELKTEKNKHVNILAKYEDLGEEYALTKAKIGVEKQTIITDLQNTKQELASLTTEHDKLKTLYHREKSQVKNDYARESPESNNLDKMRYNSLLAEKESQIEMYKKENEAINYQINYMRKECDEMRKKLDDYQKVNKRQRSISVDTTAMDREIRDLNNKLLNLEKSKKSELLKCKMSYEEQLASVNNEFKTLQSQIARFKKERDTYKNMLQSAQKSIGDLKHRHNQDTYGRFEKHEVTRTENLEHQLSALEDELSETKLEYSKIKTRLVADKSSYEIKMSELTTRINELEEEKVLNSGRTKIAGLRTKMELSWQKEREEQQRVLQETATLARDLRQTLFEVEKERDKERLEGKRKYDQVRKTSEEEQMESRRKIKDLQCDLLELRDAHAKLRTTNERLKKERERLKRDEDIMIRSRSVSTVTQNLSALKQLASELATVETSSSLDSKKEKLVKILDGLVSVSESMCKPPAVPTSNFSESGHYPMRNSSIHSKGSLKKRSLSLEHTAKETQSSNLWQNDNRSVTSLRSVASLEGPMWPAESDSIDSRLSDGSTQSDMPNERKKKKKGIIGKLKKMTKSRSIDDDSGIIGSFLGHKSKPSSSTESINEVTLKDKFTGMFKKSGSTSRSSSVERQKTPIMEVKHDTSSRQRPLMRNNTNPL